MGRIVGPDGWSLGTSRFLAVLLFGNGLASRRFLFVDLVHLITVSVEVEWTLIGVESKGRIVFLAVAR